ncbi:unnamed protein product, partial [Sphacelaria rigidula]
RRRKHSDLAGACMGLSVARQPNMWPLLRSLPEDMRVPVLYVAGALDPKYGGASSSMSPSPRSGGMGEPERRPAVIPAQNAEGVVSGLIHSGGKRKGLSVTGSALDARAELCGGEGVSVRAAVDASVPPNGGGDDSEHGVRITSFHLENFALPMKTPLQLSRCRLTERRGVLVRLEGEATTPFSKDDTTVSSTEPKGGEGGGRSRSGSGVEGRLRVWGVGEVTPLPVAAGSVSNTATLSDWLNAGLAHVATPPGAGETAVARAATAARVSEYKIPLLSASPTLCFNCHAAKSQVLLPCVEAGLEMALLHVTAKASGTAIGVAMSKASGDLPCRGTIEINALSTRNESRTPTGEVR